MMLDYLDSSQEIEEIIARTASMSRFRKLAFKHDAIVQVKATHCRAEAQYYLSKSKDHNIGDVKEPAYNFRAVFMLITDGGGFAATLAWYEHFPKAKPPVFMFDNAKIGGPKAGYDKRSFFQSTETLKEVQRCLTH